MSILLAWSLPSSARTIKYQTTSSRRRRHCARLGRPVQSGALPVIEGYCWSRKIPGRRRRRRPSWPTWTRLSAHDCRRHLHRHLQRLRRLQPWRRRLRYHPPIFCRRTSNSLSSYPLAMAASDRFSRQDFTESRMRGSHSKCKDQLSQSSSQPSKPLSQPSQPSQLARAARRPSQSSSQVRPSCSCHAAAK